MEQQTNKLNLPFVELIKKKGIYYMLETTFNELLEGTFEFKCKENKTVEKISPVIAHHFQMFIQRRDLSITHKNGFAIFKKL